MFRLLSFLIVVWSGIAIAAEAPDFAIQTKSLNGLLSDYRNKVVYVDFWASWCSPCRRSFPWMNALKERYQGEGLIVLAVNVDKERALADEFLKQVPAKFDIIFDETGDIAREYKVLGMPSSYLIDRTGNIRYVHTGFYENKQEKYEQELRTLLNEKPEVSLREAKY